MKWNYSGDPRNSPMDETRFLVGDTNKDQPQVSDDEVNWALSKGSFDTTLAAALVCEHLSRKFSRQADCSVGEVSRSCSQIAKAYKDRATELREQLAQAIVLPSFGGQSKDQKRALDTNVDAVQPAFSIGMDDIDQGQPNIMFGVQGGAGTQRFQIPLLGPRDGVNMVFRTPEAFVLNSERVYRNGQRIFRGLTADYITSEGDGSGTGWNTIVLLIPPAPIDDDPLFADYTPID